VIRFPNCKINLGLNVIGKRADGFHNIETCMYPIPFRDVLEILPAQDGIFELTTTGIEIPSDGKPNLCERACQLFDYPPVKIFLHKVIPPGTGLGAGSSNAASTLVMLNQMLSLNLSIAELKEKALRLGSDCPFFVENIPSIATGRGEVLEPAFVDLSGFSLVLIIPNVYVSTALAYSLIKPEKPLWTIKEIVKMPLSQWKGFLKNDFEPIVFEKHPILAKIKEWLYQKGAIYASMSGSGSVIFGIFETKPKMEPFTGLEPVVFQL